MSLISRALTAIVLMISFYVLALGLSGGLLWVAYANATSEHVQGRFILFCVLAAGSVLWAIAPRPDRFPPPGPQAQRADEPELFAALQEVADRTGQEIPAEVYFVNDVNAFVTSRGGIMGFGSRRVMGLGLPLMQAVSVQEFKAILAHEFGHYHGGDVALGPWIHKTRTAIGRTIQQLHEHVLQFIFVWYGNLFLRVSHAVSRRQEFVADEVAARAAGARPLMSGLRSVHAAAVAFRAYWQNELAPVLQSGHLPPINAGFSRFMTAGRVAAFLDAVVRHEEEEGTANPFDTHPPLRERVAALSQFPAGDAGDTRRASALLRNVGRWERDVLGFATGPEWARGLKPVDWEHVVEQVYLPTWRERVDRHGRHLEDWTIGSIPATKLEFARLGTRYYTSADSEDSVEARVGRGFQLVNAAIGLRLVALGWTVEKAPGEEPVFRRDGQEFRPWSELAEVVEGKRALADWWSRCAALGVAEVPLSGAAAAT